MQQTERTAIALTDKRGESRVDSRLIAQALGRSHQNVRELLQDYRSDFEELGILRFQPGEIAGRGQPEKFAPLNEDQAYLLLTYARNTARVRKLKIKLVRAFGEARRKAELHTEYLPEYHRLHDQLHALATDGEHERYLHLNINRLVNKAAGVETGQRSRVGVSGLARVMVAQELAANAMLGATGHQDAYQRAKAAVSPLMALEVC